MLACWTLRNRRVREKASEQNATGHIRLCEEGPPSGGDADFAAIIRLEPSDAAGRIWPLPALLEEPAPFLPKL